MKDLDFILSVFGRLREVENREVIWFDDYFDYGEKNGLEWIRVEIEGNYRVVVVFYERGLWFWIGWGIRYE